MQTNNYDAEFCHPHCILSSQVAYQDRKYGQAVSLDMWSGISIERGRLKYTRGQSLIEGQHCEHFGRLMWEIVFIAS